MLISIIVPAFNEEKYIGSTLERINHALETNKEQDVQWELIVCDNNSSDRTAEIAAEMGAKIAFEPVNQIAKARNRGAALAAGAWLLFIDADSYPTPELMKNVIEMMRSGKYIGCGTTVLVEGGTLFNKLRLERLNPLFRLFNWSGGAFLLCSREAFQAIGGFSTALYAFEEIDFVLRLKRYGRGTNRKFTVIHRHPVITSGRKGDYNLFSLGVLFISNFAAVILFLLHYLLPPKIIRKVSSILLRYWYNSRR